MRGHTIQGTLCDPYYGGNANFVGWDMIGYPGVRIAATADQQRMDPHLKPTHVSAYDFSMFNRAGAGTGAPSAMAAMDMPYMPGSQMPGMGDHSHDD